MGEKLKTPPPETRSAYLAGLAAQITDILVGPEARKMNICLIEVLGVLRIAEQSIFAAKAGFVFGKGEDL